MGDMAESKVRGMLDDKLFLIKHYSYEISNLAAGAQVTITATNLGMSVPDGYYPLAMVGFNCGNPNLTTSRLLNNKTASQIFILTNRGDSKITSATVNFHCLYVKESYVTDITS